MLFVRFGGVIERGQRGMQVLRCFPDVLVPPGSGPPQESYRDLQVSRSLSFVKPKSFSFADGAKAFRKAAKEQRLTFREASHSRMQYTKKVTSRKPNQSKTCGTQVADVNWEHLKKFIPVSVWGSQRFQLESWMQSYVYRKNANRLGKSLYEQLSCIF